MSPLTQGAEWHESQQSSAFYRVPTEIWREIFQCATTIPGKDEFSNDGVAYDILPREETTFSAMLTRSELSKVLGIRYSIVRVCRYWYQIAIELLWSHLRLSVDNEEPLGQVIKNLTNIPELCRSVIRLTLRGVRYFKVNQPEFKQVVRLVQNHLLPLLSNLRILTCHRHAGIYELPATLTIAVCTIYRPAIADMGLSTLLLWDKLSSLYLEIAGVEGPGMGPTRHCSFPRLTSLFLSCSYVPMIHTITELWDTPVLETLSLHGSSGAKWAKFLRRNRSTLKQLELCVVESWPPVEILPIEMPSLSSLSLASLHPHWITIVQAPRLSKAIIFKVNFIRTFHSTRRDILTFAQSVISSYPSITALRLYEEGPFLSPTTRVGLTEKDISKLEGGGVTIDIRGVSGWRTVKYAKDSAYILSKVVDNHPELRQYRDDTLLHDRVIEDHVSGSKQWQSYFDFAGFKGHGEVCGDQQQAQDSAAASLLVQVRKRELVNGPL